MKNNKSYKITKGKKTNCFFIIPSVIKTNSKQNTWNSETKSFVIGFLSWFIQIDIITINKVVDYTITKEVLQNIHAVLSKNKYFVADIGGLEEYLKANKNIILLIKNSPIKHKYTQNTIFNILQYQSFVKAKNNG